MITRVIVTAGLVLWAVAGAAAGESVPTVVGVALDPGDLDSITVVGETIEAATVQGRRWVVEISALEAALVDPSPRVTPTWLAQPSTNAETEIELEPGTPTQIAGFEVTAVARFAGEVVLGTFGGGLRRSSGEAVEGSPKEVSGLAEVDPYLWIAHRDGLAAFDGRTVTQVDVGGIPVSDVTAIELVGDEVWVGSFDQGLVRWSAGRWRQVSTATGHGGGWINSLCWDGSDLWVGSAAGLGAWDKESGRVVPVDRLDQGVQSIRCEGGGLVVATASSVWSRNGGDWVEMDFTGDALHTALKLGNEYWVAGLRGLIRGRGSSWDRATEINGRLPDSWVTALLSVGGSVWVGTYDAGLLEINDRWQWRTLVSDAWVNPNALTAIDSGVAVGTMGDGLLLFESATGRWRRMTTADGLPSDDVTALRADGRDLWVGTRAGLARVCWIEPR